MIISIASGRGGTGKTPVATGTPLSRKIKGKVRPLNCDVAAADLRLLLKPPIKEEHEFWSGQFTFIDEGKCTQCDLRQDVRTLKPLKIFKLTLYPAKAAASVGMRVLLTL